MKASKTALRCCRNNIEATGQVKELGVRHHFYKVYLFSRTYATSYAPRIWVSTGIR